MVHHTTRSVDVHHHFFPSSLDKAASSASVGFRTPPEHLPWTPKISLDAMETLGIDLAILSVPAGYPPTDIRSFAVARDVNQAMADVCRAHPLKFAFWGCLGDWRDVQAALKLIPYVLDDLKAVGIAVSSVYGKGEHARYIGDDAFDPIWEELNRRKAVVFLHGAQTSCSTPIPHPTLGLPITEAPHETFRAISHLVVSGKTLRFSEVALVLAHLGGTTLALTDRVAALSRYMGSELSEEQILAEFRRCWWDTALSAGDHALAAAMASGLIERMAWGSDFPAVPLDTIRWFDGRLTDFISRDGRVQMDGIRGGNILRLFHSRGVYLFPEAA